MSGPTCADILARTLRRAGIDVMFGLPGGEILDFIETARRAGIRFLLTRHEATAAFMADVTLASLEEAVREGLRVDGPAVIDAVVDPAEYVAHHPRQAAKAHA